MTTQAASTAQLSDPVLVVTGLVAGTSIPVAEHAPLVRDLQRGAAAAVLLDLDALDGAAREVARATVDRGERARRRLLEFLLPTVLESVWRPGAHVGAETVTAAVAATVTGLLRGEPGNGEDVAEWLRGWLPDRVTPTAPTARNHADGAGAAVRAVARIRAALIGSQLDGEEEQVVVLRCAGLDGVPLTLEEVGRALGLTRGEVRAREARVMAKLRRHPSRATR